MLAPDPVPEDRPIQREDPVTQYGTRSEKYGGFAHVRSVLRA
jgi:hypothetical protein